MPTDPVASRDRVIKALNFEEPDRVPRYEGFWEEFADAWREQRQAPPDADPHEAYEIDMTVVAADETAWPSRSGELERNGSESLVRTGWGAVHRRFDSAKFYEELEPGLAERTDPDKLVFEDPLADTRYEEAGRRALECRDRVAVFAKTGGPYLRAATVRGMENFLMDVAEDPGWVKAFVDRLTDHMLTVGVEQIRRFGVQSTGIGIFDDIATNTSPMMGVDSYERLFYPSLRKMVRAYKEAGAAKVFHHCDGYVGDVLDLWVDAGIDAVHPLEYRTGLDPVAIREKYDGRLAIIGGLDNCEILPEGDRERVRDHILHILRAGRGGGFIMAGHSIGPDVSVETYDYVHELWRRHGTYPLQL